MSARGRLGALRGLAGLLGLAFASSCSAITGADAYSDVTACTGSLCSLQCAAQGGIWDDASLTCSCESGPLCGGATGSCCGGTAPTCVTEESGAQHCSACTAASFECGAVCCEGQTCLNASLGACGVSYGSPRASCAGGLTCPVHHADGSTEEADCCDDLTVLGGMFEMGLDPDGKNQCPVSLIDSDGCTAGGDETPQHAVTLAPYMLDRFEVTVGRFRKFLESWDYVGLPEGAGGVATVAGAGWDSSWNASLPTSKSDLENDVLCNNPIALETEMQGFTYLPTWTPAPGANETRPIICVTWFEAFAFCVWDGGRLPTEAEWEYAAANGSAGDLYPWGQALATLDLVVDNCFLDGTCQTPPALPAPVGSVPLGANRWGHLDLAGNADEWVLDAWAPYPTYPVSNYADVTSGLRVSRGGSFGDSAAYVRAAFRSPSAPDETYPGTGFRCAHAPPSSP